MNGSGTSILILNRLMDPKYFDYPIREGDRLG